MYVRAPQVPHYHKMQLVVLLVTIRDLVVGAELLYLYYE